MGNGLAGRAATSAAAHVDWLDTGWVACMLTFGPVLNKGRAAEGLGTWD